MYMNTSSKLLPTVHTPSFGDLNELFFPINNAFVFNNRQQVINLEYVITLSSVYTQPWLHATVVLKQKVITGNVSNYTISTSCLLMLWSLVAPVNCVAGLI